MKRVSVRLAALATCVGSICAVPTAAQALQGSTRQTFSIPAQPLGSALRQVAMQAGRNLLVDDALVAGRSASAVEGVYTVEEILEQLLESSGLGVRTIAGNLVLTRVAESDPGEAIVVTGTRIRGRAPVGSNVLQVSRRDIERSGYATLQDVLQTIPQNFGGAPNEGTAAISLDPNSGKNTGSGSSLNLRGLGNQSTLVLLNGDRPPLGGFGGVFSDISLIPASAVERVEVIADGASAIYGSDAVAGVVNVIPRLRFEGGETSARLGSADGDSQDLLFSQLIGTRIGGGHAVAAYEFYRRSPLAASARSYITDDLSRFGGPDLRGPYASPGNIIAGDELFAIPGGQNGTAFDPDDLIAGAANLADSWAMVDALPMQKRHSLFAAVDHPLTDTLDVYGQLLFSKRKFDGRSRTINDAPRLVPVTNPFTVDPLGTGDPILVQYDFGADLGRERSVGSVRGLGLTMGTRATLGRWAVDVRANHGRQQEENRILNRVNSARLALALADPDPATAYNPFGTGGSTNPETVDKVRGSTSSSNGGRVWSAAARADGPVFNLPAGEIRIAVGAEFRREHYRAGPTISDTSTLQPVVLDPIPLPGARRIRAGYAEALIPIFGADFAVPGANRLDVALALRSERYSDFGATTNPRVGVTWEPVAGLGLRGTYGTSFRAPSFDNLRQDPGTKLLFAFPIPDPQSPTGQSNVLVERGNDPELRPETATTWSIGADFEPGFARGLKAGVTYFNIDYRNRITSPAANLFNFLVNRETYQAILTDNPSAEAVAAFYASPYFVNPFGIAPDTIIAIADARLQNLSVVRQSGLDADVRYAFDLFGGSAEVGAAGTYLFKIDQALTPTAPVSDVVDILGNPVDLRVRARALWSNGRWGVSLFANYLDSYTNLTNVLPERVASWTTLDAQVSFATPQSSGLLSGLKFSLSATNLLDSDPPYAAYNLGLLVTGYDPDNASPLGRVVSFQVTKAW